MPSTQVKEVEGLDLALDRAPLTQITAQQCILQTIDVDGFGQKNTRSEFAGSERSLTAAVAGEYCDHRRWRASFEDLDYVETAVLAEPEIDHCVAIVDVGLVFDGQQSIEPLYAVAAIHKFENQGVGENLVVIDDQQSCFCVAHHTESSAGCGPGREFTRSHSLNFACFSDPLTRSLEVGSPSHPEEQ